MILLIASHCLVIIPLGLAYCIANYMTTKAQGKPVYSFLTWEDHTSFVIVAGLFMATFAVFWLLAVFTQTLSRFFLVGIFRFVKYFVHIIIN